jgi:hypothetical protein
MEFTLMKRLWFIAILAASTSACVEGNNAVQLLSAITVDPESCGAGDVALYSGRLNFNAGQSYRIYFELFSPVAREDEATQTPAAFYAEEIVYNYDSKTPKVTFTEETLPIYAVVEAGAQPGDNRIMLNLIGTEARKKLDAAVPASPDFMTLFATVKLRGKLPSGNGVETNEVTYPINITRARACAAGTEPASTSPCGFAGQDQFFDTFNCVPTGG